MAAVVPTPNPADLGNLQAIYSGLLAELAREQAYYNTFGSKASYSLDGASVSWTEWFVGKTAQIGVYKRLIQDEQVPFAFYTRGTT